MTSFTVDHPLLRVQLVVAVVLALAGVVVCAVAGYLAAEVSKYKDARYATFWMGIVVSNQNLTTHHVLDAEG